MIVIKSYKGGIALHLNEEEEFDDLLMEIADKFEESRKFFRDASLALSIEGRRLSVEEEKMIIQTIDEHSDLNIICLVGKNEETDRGFIKALKRVELQREENNGRFYTGDVEDGEVIESEGSLVIIGSVRDGGTVAATKDIIILGELAGDAYAGLDNNEGHFIAAARLNPHMCKIGSLNYSAGASKGLFDKKKNVPCIIYEQNGELISDILGPETTENVTTIQTKEL